MGKSKSVVLKSMNSLGPKQPSFNLPHPRKSNKRGINAQLKRHFSMAVGGVNPNDVYDVNAGLKFK